MLYVVVLLASIGWGAAAMADSTGLSGHRKIVFDRLGPEDGLSQAVITTITQDRQGFIWIGGQEGLHRYDGYTFKTYYHLDSDPGSLSSDSIFDVLEDSSGRLWVATASGLNRFDAARQSFDHIVLDRDGMDSVQHSQVHVLYEDRSGTLWVGTVGGLMRLESDGSFTHFHHTDDDFSIGAGTVGAVYEDSRGLFWVGTEDGLFRMDRSTGRFYSIASDFESTLGHAISRDYIRSIAEDSDGRLWIGPVDGGVTVLDPRTGDVRNLDSGYGLGSDKVRTILKDPDGNMWVGVDSGGLNLWVADRERFQTYTMDPTDRRSLSDNSVMDLFQDRGGVMWVATLNGVSKWNAELDTFPHYKIDSTTQGGLIGNLITSFAEDPETGDVWIGTFEGVSHWDAGTGQFSAYPSEAIRLADDRVTTLAIYRGELWIGTMNGGITVLKDREANRRYVHDPIDSESLSANAISKLYLDSRRRLWVGTYGGGLNLYLGDGRFRRYPENGATSEQFSDLRIGDVIEVEDGVMWVGTHGGGVVILDTNTGEISNFRYEGSDAEGLSSDRIITLLKTSDAIWIGTRDSGVDRYDLATSAITRYAKSDGLASDSIFGMVEDDDGNIWISGGKGLSVLNPRTDVFTTYDYTDGLQSDDFTSGAYLKLSNGNILFGGSNGFNAIDPSRTILNTYEPQVQITKFTKFNDEVLLPEPIYQTDTVEIEHGDSVIGFEFAALDFTTPEKNQYQYMLEGFDEDWVDAKNTRQVTYTNLDAGKYTFKVRGSNNDGVWSNNVASVGLVVNPPIWATWWAYVAYFIAGIGVLYRAQRANEARLRREAEKRYSERLQLYIESLEEATDCIMIADSNKNLMYANNAIHPILGLSPADAVGESILTLLFADLGDADLARQGLQREGRWHGEVKTKRENQLLTTEVTIAAVRDESENETAYVSIARDITDRKRTEAELDNHRRNLEFLVAERTKALEREIAENKLVQRELANSLEEKELLLKEVHHRVKNNMQVISSLLNIQAESINNPDFAKLLGESQQRIKSMSLIHENLYQSENLLEIDFEDYIKMLANSLCRFYTIPGVTINLDINVENVGLDLETAVPVGLIINELISNSLKHAFVGREGPGTISVRFHNDGCRYVLCVCDDGAGLPPGFEPSSSTSMGMEIVSILTQQLDGRILIDGNEGASFEISFPRKEKMHA